MSCMLIKDTRDVRHGGFSWSQGFQRMSHRFPLGLVDTWGCLGRFSYRLDSVLLTREPSWSEEDRQRKDYLSPSLTCQEGQESLDFWPSACMHLWSESLQSCLILCDSVDCSPPGSSVHRILQARKLKWVAMSSSRGSSWPRDRTSVSYVSCIGRQALYQ